mmetsp:Transcript_26840/g.70549  ORF Transcript_26840/g.70549 Transcript_26840/m.70549 type:complete len:247 (+) Transcript_26840:938-1678(+)
MLRLAATGGHSLRAGQLPHNLCGGGTRLRGVGWGSSCWRRGGRARRRGRGRVARWTRGRDDLARLVVGSFARGEQVGPADLPLPDVSPDDAAGAARRRALGPGQPLLGAAAVALLRRLLCSDSGDGMRRAPVRGVMTRRCLSRTLRAGFSTRGGLSAHPSIGGASRCVCRARRVLGLLALLHWLRALSTPRLSQPTEGVKLLVHEAAHSWVGCFRWRLQPSRRGTRPTPVMPAPRLRPPPRLHRPP